MKTIDELHDEYFSQLRKLAATKPVPLPESKEALYDLACIGVVAAIEKLMVACPEKALLAHFAYEANYYKEQAFEKQKQMGEIIKSFNIIMAGGSR